MGYQKNNGNKSQRNALNNDPKSARDGNFSEHTVSVPTLVAPPKEEQMSKAQQRLNALRLKRALPPLIHGAVNQIGEKNKVGRDSTANEFTRQDNGDNTQE